MLLNNFLPQGNDIAVFSHFFEKYSAQEIPQASINQLLARIFPRFCPFRDREVETEIFKKFIVWAPQSCIDFNDRQISKTFLENIFYKGRGTADSSTFSYFLQKYSAQKIPQEFIKKTLQALLSGWEYHRERDFETALLEKFMHWLPQYYYEEINRDGYVAKLITQASGVKNKIALLPPIEKMPFDKLWPLLRDICQRNKSYSNDDFETYELLLKFISKKEDAISIQIFIEHQDELGKTCHNQVVDYFLKNKADASIQDALGRTALQHFFDNNIDRVIENDTSRQEIIKLLINAEADPNIWFVHPYNKKKRTLLQMVVCHGWLSESLLILEKANNQTLYFCDENGRNLLFHAVNSGLMTLCERIVERGFDMTKKDLSGHNSAMACEYYCFVGKDKTQELTQTLKYYFKKSQVDIEERDNDGYTALIIATIKNNVPTVKALIDCGADINACDKIGKTVLMHACASSHDICDLLLKKQHISSLNIHATDAQGATALHHAAQAKDVSLVKKLLKCGADINAQDQNGKTPIYYGIQQAGVNTGIISSLSDSDFNHQDESGTSILMHAVINNSPISVKFIIKNYDVDINQKDHEGLTPLMRSCQNKKLDCFNALIEAGADVNIMDTEGRNALMQVILSEQRTYIDRLICQGINLDAVDKYGYDICQYLIKSGDRRMMNMFTKSSSRPIPINAVASSARAGIGRALIWATAESDLSQEAPERARGQVRSAELGGSGESNPKRARKN